MPTSKTTPADTGAAPGRFLRRRDVCAETGLPTSTLYLKISKGEFPKPLKLGGPRAVAWLASEVQAWQAERIAERDRDAA